eukprot:5490598-Pleurochrysis_carterae.AAC.1
MTSFQRRARRAYRRRPEGSVRVRVRATGEGLPCRPRCNRLRRRSVAGRCPRASFGRGWRKCHRQHGRLHC